MDTTDRSDSKLPAPFPVASSPSPLSKPVFGRELAVSQAPQVDSGVLIRGLKRYGWQIFGLWLGVSAVVLCLIYETVKPTYEAISRIRVQPAQLSLYDPGNASLAPDPRSYEPYLQTQVVLLTSDLVLKRAIMRESVASMSMITGSRDAKTDLRAKLMVEIEPNTYFIRVALESQHPTEAAAIVKAVVGAYIDVQASYDQSKDANLKSELNTELTELGRQIEKKKDELKQLHQKGNVQIFKPELNLGALNDDDDGTKPPLAKVSEQQINTLIGEMVKVNLDLITAQASLKAQLEAQNTRRDADLQAQQADNELEDRVKEAFFNDPDVQSLINEMKRVKEELSHSQGLARKGSDRALVAARTQLAKLEKEWQELWDAKSEEIRKRLRVGIDNQSPQESIGVLQHTIRMLQDKKTRLAKLYERQQVEQKTNNDDFFKFNYAQIELDSLIKRKELVQRNLEQVQFQSRQAPYRVDVVDEAEVPKVPSNNKQFKYMAAAPVGVLFLWLGFFLWREIKAERVADPDVLSTRVGSEVYGLPPLPTSRELRRRNESLGDGDIDQFRQRLDHLRFAICRDSVQTGKGRCVLITSATAGEGKTTLAAQLAARCGNAGMRTLLIDADLKKGALAPMLDVPDDLGFSNLLEGNSSLDDVVIPVRGGVFSLITAGTQPQDHSIALQDGRFGSLIAQLRQRYDLIIIDCPPVLPVPDALILGRWTDGAVLAARYDKSRFPEVERARRKLDGAGITVLGTVINGMRGTDSYYGRYTYSRRRSPDTDSSNTS